MFILFIVYWLTWQVNTNHLPKVTTNNKICSNSNNSWLSSEITVVKWLKSRLVWIMLTEHSVVQWIKCSKFMILMLNAQSRTSSYSPPSTKWQLTTWSPMCTWHVKTRTSTATLWSYPPLTWKANIKRHSSISKYQSLNFIMPIIVFLTLSFV